MITKNFWLYLFITIVTIYMSLLFDGIIMRFLIAFEITLPVILFILLVIQRQCIRIEPRRQTDILRKGQPVAMTAVVKSRWMPAASVRLRGKATGMARSRRQRIESLILDESHECMHVLYMNGFTDRYGVIKVLMSKAEIYDYLSLFALPRRIGFEQNFYIIPTPHRMTMQMPSELPTGYAADNADAMYAVPSSQSDEPDEIREYRQGDDRKHIHWKLSIRTDKLMVRTHSAPHRQKAVLIFDAADNGKAASDEWYELAASIVSQLVRRLGDINVCWQYKNSVKNYFTEDEEGYITMLKELVKGAPEHICNMSGLSGNYDYVFVLNGENELSINGEDIRYSYE